MFQILEEISKKIVNKGFEVMGEHLPKTDGPVSETVKGVGRVAEEAQKGAGKAVFPEEKSKE
jgi:hypothetical protein